ncbi:uncharacterized protein LOC116661873 [Camelus ferus]|uniref:Uncharacterized protein LOC116661873 n=1 Tax=Camelus ferus TaxID=419612 RepID=A0A8B8SLG1_CAMFR|nr:uncharacterized protein LOC116661873 [Camelus ferus]
MSPRALVITTCASEVVGALLLPVLLASWGTSMVGTSTTSRVSWVVGSAATRGWGGGSRGHSVSAVTRVVGFMGATTAGNGRECNLCRNRESTFTTGFIYSRRSINTLGGGARRSGATAATAATAAAVAGAGLGTRGLRLPDLGCRGILTLEDFRHLESSLPALRTLWYKEAQAIHMEKPHAESLALHKERCRSKPNMIPPLSVPAPVTLTYNYMRSQHRTTPASPSYRNCER